MATVGGNLLQRTLCLYFRNGPAGAYACNKHEPGSGCAAIDGLDRGQAVLGQSAHCNAVSPDYWPVALTALTALTALDAMVELLGPDGRRTVPIEELYRLPGDTPHLEFTLQPGEMITAIVVPKTRAGRRSTYHKIRDRESYAFALASAAVALEMDGDRVTAARIALGGLATRPWRATAAEAGLRTRRIRVPRVVSVADCGRVVSPRTTESQVRGGVVWGISAALREETEVDPRYGGWLNNDLADYVVAVNADIGDIEVGLIDRPDPLINALGAKGLGEVAMVGVAGAVANAVFHATGVRVRKMPMRIEDLL